MGQHSNLPALLGGRPVRPDGPPPWPPERSDVVDAVKATLADGSWGRYDGGHGERLETLLRDLLDREHVELCCSGTAAVELALRGVGIGPGDEVALAGYDFKANFSNIVTLGAVPVLVDLAAANANLNPDLLDAAWSPKLRAVLVSHLHGGVVPMPAVQRWAAERGVAVIEDCCQAVGATIGGRPAGCWGDVAVFSFGGSKLLTAGRGGAVITAADTIAQRIRLYTQRGNRAYPLSELQAAVLCPQLETLAADNAQRGKRVDRLRKLLAERPGLKIFENPILAKPAYYKVGMWYDASGFGGLPRDRFAEAMRAEGIALDPGFRALQLIHAPRRFRAAGELPESIRADQSLLTLHHPVLLHPASAVDQVIRAIEKIRAHADVLQSAQRAGTAS